MINPILIDNGEWIPYYPDDRVATGTNYEKIKTGFNLLDYFAGQALAGYIKNDPAIYSDSAARNSYDDAEAMLKEREKRMKDAN